MARLHEYQGKPFLPLMGQNPARLFGSSGRGGCDCTAELGGEVVIKIQAWTTGRAGIGGVASLKSRMKFASTRRECLP
jgi:succinyl-CoA synthetase beta subunit